MNTSYAEPLPDTLTGPVQQGGDYVSPNAAEWKQEISARVQAHRLRRQPAQSELPGMETAARRNPRVNSVVASVMERYAAAPSYSEYLAGLTTAQTETAAASFAGSTADTAAGLTNDVFDSGHSYEFATSGSSALDMFAAPAITEEPAPAIELVAAAEPVIGPSAELAATARHSEVAAVSEEAAASPQSLAMPTAAAQVEDAVAQAMVEPVRPLTTKLIEFPRQLIAARRARPRVAEGPLLADAAPLTIQEMAIQDVAAETPHLRIFEVELEQDQLPAQSVAATSPAPAAALINGVDPALVAAAAALPPEWRYIQLDTPLLPGPATFAQQQAYDDAAAPALDIAPMDRRLLGAAFDLAMVTLGFLAFAAAFVGIAVEFRIAPPSDSVAMLAAGVAFATLAIGYQWLFLTLSDATPGMRYARIALCTFADDNPTRQARRGRLLGTLLAAGAAGLGFAWIGFDKEQLGWHDRISRTYQRCY